MHTLPQLNYQYNSLIPYIDAKTMEIHHTKHHQAYIDKLNAALEPYEDLQTLAIEDLLGQLDQVPQSIATAVRNHGGGHANHSLFWTIMTPNPAEEQPARKLASAIDNDFGSFSKFQEEFTNIASTHFGSGWAWLVLEQGKLHVCSTTNQDSPLMHGNTPILGLDLWEHAYYLHYQNRRPDYISAWWHVVNWPQVEQNYLKALAE
jgi:Fe-Mn family superoxide dismutase